MHIKEGDIVCVNFHGICFTLCPKAIVYHVPQATGDSWIFKDTETNQVHYVSEGCTVSLLTNIAQ